MFLLKKKARGSFPLVERPRASVWLRLPGARLTVFFDCSNGPPFVLQFGGGYLPHGNTGLSIPPRGRGCSPYSAPCGAGSIKNFRGYVARPTLRSSLGADGLVLWRRFCTPLSNLFRGWVVLVSETLTCRYHGVPPPPGIFAGKFSNLKIARQMHL